MDTIRANVTGTNEVGLRFDEFPDVLYEGLRAEIDSLSMELFGRIEAATPSRTGRLRSQERLRIFTEKDRITGRVDIAGESGSQDFGKAGALEYGAHRKTSVSSHSMKLDHAWANLLSSPEDVMVAAYDRTPNIAEHAYERGPLAAMRPEIVARLNAVVEQAVDRTNK
jgi:hypothetical protein